MRYIEMFLYIWILEKQETTFYNRLFAQLICWNK